MGGISPNLTTNQPITFPLMLTSQAQPYTSSLTLPYTQKFSGANNNLDAVATYSDIQAIAISLLHPVEYCNRPELHLEEAANDYIPRQCYEEEQSYEARLKYAFSNFQPFYRSLKSIAIGTALRKPIKLADETADSSDWQDFLDNVTLEGESITNFSKRLLEASIDSGWAGIFIDFPKIDGDLNLAQEKALGLRPYFCLIPLADVLGWQSTVETVVVGDSVSYGTRLTQLRIRDTYTEPDPDNEFVECVYPSVRVYDHKNADDFVTYRLFVLKADRKNEPERWQEIESGSLGITVIPFVPMYAGAADAFMRARPLMLDIARLNLSHWQAAADLAHALHLTSVPTMVISGVSNTGDSADLQISPDKALILNDPTAKADWVGAPSDGAEVTIQRLRELERAMLRLSPVQMQDKISTGVEAAEAKKIDRAQSDSVLSTIVTNLEDCLNKSLAIAALYWDRPLVTLDLPRDFLPGNAEPNQIKEMAAIQAGGLISHETFLRWCDANEVFDGLDEFSVEEEIERVEEETPDIDPMMLPMDPEAPENTGENLPVDEEAEDATELEGESPERES